MAEGECAVIDSIADAAGGVALGSGPLFIVSQLPRSRGKRSKSWSGKRLFRHARSRKKALLVSVAGKFLTSSRYKVDLSSFFASARFFDGCLQMRLYFPRLAQVREKEGASRANRIKHDITEACGPVADEGLMPLVARGKKKGAETRAREGLLPVVAMRTDVEGPEQQPGKNKKFAEMAEFS